MTILSDLFHVKYGNKLDMNKMTPSSKHDGIAFVGRVGGLGGKSGIAGYVEPIAGLEVYPSGYMTVALGGSRLLSTYVQQRAFYTAQNVAVLQPCDPEMPLTHRLYYAMCIKANDFRYSAFGREANRTLSSLAMPAEVPPWVETQVIPDYTKLGKRLGEQKLVSNVAEWGEYRVADLFDLESGKYVPAKEKLPGTTPEVTSSSKNNGAARRLSLAPNFSGGTISVARNGTVGTAFFQPVPFFATDDSRVWKAKKGKLTASEALFICAVIELEKFRYSYGRKWSVKHMKETRIRLPARSDGSPDWAFMSSVMEGLPFGGVLTARQ